MVLGRESASAATSTQLQAFSEALAIEKVISKSLVGFVDKEKASVSAGSGGLDPQTNATIAIADEIFVSSSGLGVNPLGDAQNRIPPGRGSGAIFVRADDLLIRDADIRSLTVTQQNAANSEESSSAASELSGQAEELAAMVGSFQLDQAASVAPRRAGLAAPAKAMKPKAPARAHQNGKNGHGHIALRPEEVIPMENDPAFKEF